MPLLQILLQETLDDDEGVHATMLLCISAFNDIIMHFDGLGAFLSLTEYAKGMNFVKRFMDSYQDLNSRAQTKNRKIFHITHKFHSLAPLQEH